MRGNPEGDSSRVLPTDVSTEAGSHGAARRAPRSITWDPDVLAATEHPRKLSGTAWNSMEQSSKMVHQHGRPEARLHAAAADMCMQASTQPRARSRMQIERIVQRSCSGLSAVNITRLSGFAGTAAAGEDNGNPCGVSAVRRVPLHDRGVHTCPFEPQHLALSSGQHCPRPQAANGSPLSSRSSVSSFVNASCS